VLDFRALLTGEGLISLISLVALEIVLGIDNIVFIAIISERIEPRRRSTLRRAGLGLALILRLGLLASLSWLMSLTRPLFSIAGSELSGRDLVLLAGGLFLIAKAAHELFQQSEEPAPAAPGGGSPASPPSQAGDKAQAGPRPGASFSLMLAQILVLDIVFSLDSVITAVGMARQVSIMVVAMVVAVAIMLLAANTVSDFITRHPSLKVLALSFLLMVGVLLVADAFDKHVPKGYVYFAMAYALGVELINIRRRRARQGGPRPQA
jgi:predicted tellurium resistance membrane protein TerC